MPLPAIKASWESSQLSSWSYHCTPYVILDLVNSYMKTYTLCVIPPKKTPKQTVKFLFYVNTQFFFLSKVVFNSLPSPFHPSSPLGKGQDVPTKSLNASRNNLNTHCLRLHAEDYRRHSSCLRLLWAVTINIATSIKHGRGPTIELGASKLQETGAG